MEPNDRVVLQIGGHSSHMRAVMEMAARVALVDTTVLLTGESGVGNVTTRHTDYLVAR